MGRGAMAALAAADIVRDAEREGRIAPWRRKRTVMSIMSLRNTNLRSALARRIARSLRGARIALAVVLLLAVGAQTACGGRPRRAGGAVVDSGMTMTDGAPGVDLGSEPVDLGVASDASSEDLGSTATDLGAEDLGSGPVDLGGPRDLGPPDLGGPGPVGVGDLVVTELIANPAAVSDTNGEWFEIYNTTARTIDLLGLVFRDDDTNAFTVDVSVMIPAGGYLVLGRNASTTTNGGVVVNYVYPGSSFYIDNAGDEIVIERAGVVIDRVAYTSPTEGASWSLDPRYFDSVANDAAVNWCDALSAYGLGDLGTPGRANDFCF